MYLCAWACVCMYLCLSMYLSACMYLCVCRHVFVHVSLCVGTCLYVSVSKHVCVCMCIHVCVGTCLCMYLCVWARVCMYLCLSMYLCMCACIYVCVGMCLCVRICTCACIREVRQKGSGTTQSGLQSWFRHLFMMSLLAGRLSRLCLSCVLCKVGLLAVVAPAFRFSGRFHDSAHVKNQEACLTRNRPSMNLSCCHRRAHAQSCRASL